jgi:predicted AAA+ superfamily ATPase
MIKREQYIKELLSLKDKNVIKVITGMRRVGKSTIMQMYKERLQKMGVRKNQIVFMNFEDIENKKWLSNYENLYYHIVKQLDLSKNCYVFLDEVQNIKEFERLIDGLFIKPNLDVYVTGSNAYLLSSELATLLTGRYMEIHILPFSFKEYLSAFKKQTRIDLIFNKYLVEGGMPETHNMPQEKLISNYLKSVYDSILQKDIFVRNNWHKNNNFGNIVRFLLDSVGSPISSSKIANTLKSSGIKVSHHTVDSYLNAVCESYLFYRVSRFDLKGRNILRTMEKFYVADIGFKKAILGGRTSMDFGHNLENIVFLELLRRGNRVNTGKADCAEIDFVIQNLKGETEYIQVAYTAREQSTLERELKPLQMIKDFNRRTLITADVEPESNFKGIRKVNVIDWLME